MIPTQINQHSEHEHSHHSFKISFGSVLAIAGALTTSAVMLSPDLLPDILDKFDLGSDAFQASANNATSTVTHMCHNSGIVGEAYSLLSDGVSSIPLIGEKLAEGTMVTPLVGTGLIIAAKPAMNLTNKISHNIIAFDNGKTMEVSDETAQKDDVISVLTSTIGEWAMKGAGMAMILYTALPAIGHGIGYLMLANDIGNPDIISNILQETGSTAPWHHQMMMDSQGVNATGIINGITAAAAPHISCLAAIAGASGSYIIDNEDKYHTQSSQDKLANNISNQAGYEHNHIKQEMNISPDSIISHAEHINHAHSGMIQSLPSIIASIEPQTKLQPFINNERTLKLNWRDTGAPVKLDELEILHAEPVHMFINNPQMNDYHHIHPQPTNIEGEYSFNITPTTTDSYRSWLDIKPKGQEGGIFQIEQDMLGNNITPLIKSFTKPSNIEQKTLMKDGKDTLTQTLNVIGNIKAGSPQTAILNIRRASGKEVILQDIMEAKAHLVGFYPDYKTLLHTHPEGEPISAINPKDGVNLSFHFTPEMDGALKLFSQILVDDNEYFSGFDVPIQAQKQQVR